MSGEKVDFQGAAEANFGASGARKNERSTISFPYLDLDTAVEVAKKIYERAGLGDCTIEELAAQMGQTVSGAFRLKISTTKLFGFADSAATIGYRLSGLGERVIHSETEEEARSEAFLSVPLYTEVYEKYKGHHLPPAKALEREMVALGVAPKQSDKARRGFLLKERIV